MASEICKGPRRLMGWISSVDGAPWMALRDGPRVYVQWGTAPENSNYDDSYRNLVNYYTRKNISVSYLRAKKKNDTDRVLALYGSADERYW